MTDPHPPDEVGDVERPGDRLVDAPDTDALREKIADGDQEKQRQCRSNA